MEWNPASVPVAADDPCLIVRPEVSRRQMGAEAPAVEATTLVQESVQLGGMRDPSAEEYAAVPARPHPRRYYGSVKLDPTHVGRDASQIAEEVIAHPVGLVRSDVRLTLEIKADIPDGAPEHVVRVVTENSRGLRFEDTGVRDRVGDVSPGPSQGGSGLRFGRQISRRRAHRRGGTRPTVGAARDRRVAG